MKFIKFVFEQKIQVSGNSTLKEQLSFKEIRTTEAFQELLSFTDKEIKVIKNIKQSIKERLDEDRENADKSRKLAQGSKSNLLNEFSIERVNKFKRYANSINHILLF